MAKNATQKGKIIGKLKSLKRSEVATFESGTEYVDYNARIELPNGVSLFNRKRVFNPNSPSEYSAKTMNTYEEMIEKLEEAITEGVEILVEKRIAPSKDKDNKDLLANTFNSITSYEKDGNIRVSLEGDIQLIEPESIQPLVDENDKVVDYEITFTGQTSDYTIVFSEYETIITLEMVLAKVDAETRHMTFEDLQDYPKTVVLELLPAYPIDGAEVGQGYKGIIVFEKGQKISETEVSDDEDTAAVWGQEAKETKSKFTPDKFYFKPLGIVKGLTKEIKAKDATAKKVAKKADLDF